MSGPRFIRILPIDQVAMVYGWLMIRGAPDHPMRIRFEISRENPIVMISVEVSASGVPMILSISSR